MAAKTKTKYIPKIINGNNGMISHKGTKNKTPKNAETNKSPLNQKIGI